MCDIRVTSEDEFTELAVQLRNEYGKIQIRVHQAVLTGKWFVGVYRFCKDFPPAGTFDLVATFVTMDEKVALKMTDLEKGK
ncbi:MAG: hypothetical protein M1469_02505 [Bacteroidetes bacterium]|nr:hypothetical protein [Bacteroidota bacterium]